MGNTDKKTESDLLKLLADEDEKRALELHREFKFLQHLAKQVPTKANEVAATAANEAARTKRKAADARWILYRERLNTEEEQ